MSNRIYPGKGASSLNSTNQENTSSKSLSGVEMSRSKLLNPIHRSRFPSYDEIPKNPSNLSTSRNPEDEDDESLTCQTELDQVPSDNHAMNTRLKKIAHDLSSVTNDQISTSFSSRIDAARASTRLFLETTAFGALYSEFMMALSIGSAVQFIHQTYQYTDEERLGVELGLAIAIGLDWALQFFIADHRWHYFFSPSSICDLTAVLPIFLTYGKHCPHINTIHSSYETFQFILCGLATTRILRALRLSNRLEAIEDEVHRLLASMSLSIMVMILFNSALMQYLETEQGYQFHTWTYFMLVTCTTVGYGDITPRTDMGRVAAMAMIGFAIIKVPQMTNELIEKMGRQSIYARKRYIPSRGSTGVVVGLEGGISGGQHVVICGDLSSCAVSEFFAELFHEDHDAAGLHAVILQPSLPGYELLSIMRAAETAGRITYLEGNPLNDNDLKRALAARAIAVFILTNKFSSDPDEEDAKTILQQFSIKRHLRLHGNSASKASSRGIIGYLTGGAHVNSSATHHGPLQTLFCVQLIRPENKRHLVATSTVNGEHPRELVICLNETKMGVIAKAVVFPGANTLIMNLLTSFADDKPAGGVGNLHGGYYTGNWWQQLLGSGFVGQYLSGGVSGGTIISPMDGIETLEEDEDGSDWIGEYQRGCDWEIYTTQLAEAFIGATFAQLSDLLYQALGIVLFALEIEDLSRDRSSIRLLLNPAEFIIPPQTTHRVTAFVIAKNKAQSDLSQATAAEAGEYGVTGLTALTSAFAKGFASALRAPSGSFVSIGESSSTKETPNTPSSSRNTLKIVSPSRASKYTTSSFSNNNAGRKDIQAWQALLRCHEADRKADKLHAEDAQRMEDHHLRDNFYTRDSPVELSDVLIRTSATDELPLIDGHIILIGKALSNLYDLIRPLRARILGVLKPIVILYPAEFPLAVWQRISIFEDVWIVRGSPLEEADIRRCGIFKAKQVVLLADPGNSGNGSHRNGPAPPGSGSSGFHAAGLEALQDVDVIFTYQAVRRLNGACRTVVEIIRPTNVAYLDPESGLSSSDIDYKFTPQFASGALFATGLLDTLVCQAFYNVKILEIVNRLVGTGNDRKNSVYNSAAVSSGNKSPLKDQHPQSQSPGGNQSIPLVLGSSLYQIPIPDGLESRTYGALYSLLAKRGQVPLGLLRGVYSNTGSGPKANKSPYVFTNPPKDTELFSCDRVFVLSQTPVRLSRNPGMTHSKEDARGADGGTPVSLLRPRKKTVDDVHNMVDTLRDELRAISIAHTNLESSMVAMNTETTARFNSLMSAIESLHSHSNPTTIPQR